VGDTVSEQEQVDAILEGLPEEFNSFVMMVYSRFESPTVEDVEALLLLQEVQFEKFRQELTNPSVSANIAHKESKNSNSSDDADEQEIGTEHYNVNVSRGRGRGKGRGRGRGKAQFKSNSKKVQCQICAKPNHDAANCWHRYEPPNSRPNARGYNAGFAPRPSHFNPYARPSANLAIPQYYTHIPDIDTVSSASWYPDSGASHHLTFNPQNLAYRIPYQGQDQVTMGNGQGVSIKSLGYANFYSPYNPNVHLKLHDLLHVPSISKNLLSDSKQILLKGTVGPDGLYKFQPFEFTPTLSNNFSHQSSSTSSLHKSDSPISSHFSALNNTVHCNNALSIRNLDNSFYTWHLRLGHAHNKAVETVLKWCNIPYSNKTAITPCVSCCAGKSHRLHAPVSSTIYTKPFEFQASVKALQSDWGGEFRSFTTLLNSL
ncbi:retrovirus-related Pol polyprotein from transposon TNT 1-94, partial [Trifolium pratense]